MEWVASYESRKGALKEHLSKDLPRVKVTSKVSRQQGWRFLLYWRTSNLQKLWDTKLNLNLFSNRFTDCQIWLFGYCWVAGFQSFPVKTLKYNHNFSLVILGFWENKTIDSAWDPVTWYFGIIVEWFVVTWKHRILTGNDMRRLKKTRMTKKKKWWFWEENGGNKYSKPLAIYMNCEMLITKSKFTSRKENNRLILCIKKKKEKEKTFLLHMHQLVLMIDYNSSFEYSSGRPSFESEVQEIYCQ